MPGHSGGLGDAPIEKRYRKHMRRLAKRLNREFNGALPRGRRHTGFVMLVFPFNDHDGRCNYASNASREDVVVLLREQLRRFEGAPDDEGHA